MESYVSDLFDRSGYFTIHKTNVLNISDKEILKLLSPLNKLIIDQLFPKYKEQLSTQKKANKVLSVVNSGELEMIRIRDKKVEFLEVKSKYVETDYRLEIQISQFKKFNYFLQHGYDIIICHCVAFPTPRYIEIPWSIIRNNVKFNERKNGTSLRFKIPFTFRRQQYQKLLTFPFSTEGELFKHLANH